jgi:hypothetical protein
LQPQGISRIHGRLEAASLEDRYSVPVLALLMALSLTVASGCRATGRSPQLEGAVQHDSVAQVLARHTERLMALPGVVGTAESTCGGRPCILVLVARKTPELEHLIPAELEGIPVEVRETGPIRALDSG